MTIHSDFFKLAKEGCAQAFTEAAPKRPDVVFIDGQVKLMKADAIDSWPLFFRIQFFRTSKRALPWVRTQWSSALTTTNMCLLPRP